MVNKKDMKSGLLVWWSADRYMKSWSCPAVVTVVEDEYFKVRSLDDFKETDFLRMDDISNLDKSVRNAEMRICKLEEVQDYFKKHTRHLEDAATEATRTLKDIEDELTMYKKQTSDFLKML